MRAVFSLVHSVDRSGPRSPSPVEVTRSQDHASPSARLPSPVSLSSGKQLSPVPSPNPSPADDQEIVLDVISPSSLPRWMRGSYTYLKGRFDGEDESVVMRTWLKFERLVEGASVRLFNSSIDTSAYPLLSVGG